MREWGSVSLPSKVFKSKRHDTAVSPRPTFTPSEALDWDLMEPGVTVTFIMRLPGATVPKINAPATVVGPWTVRYDPEPEDVDTIGTYDVEVEAVRADGRKLTLPTEGFLNWTIGPDLDNA